MGPFWSKLDAGLATVYSNFLEIERKGRDNVGWVHPGLRRKVAGAHVRLRFQGSLAEIERAGFETTWVRSDNRLASGIVRFATLEAVASAPGVILLSYGSESELDLDRSIQYLHADVLRQYSTASHFFTGITGRNVLIAVLDSGADYTHDFLQEPRDSDDELRETRIVRIWDQGLVAVSGEQSPDSALLHGRPTYGVEYTEDDINAELNDDPEATVRVRHRDCNGHGTHVASIAAGTGGRARKYVGMAPRAMIIVVKVLSLENLPRPGGMVVSAEQRFADAVDYALNVAATPELGNRRVVLNYSASFSDPGPHDGLSDREEALLHVLNADARRIFVGTAGNQGGRGRQSRARIPAGQSTVAIPCILTDERDASHMRGYGTCRVADTGGDVSLEIWYRDSPAPVGGTLEIEDEPDAVDIPALFATSPTTTFGQGQTYRLEHQQQVAEVESRQIRRNVIRLTVTPSDNRYQSGRTRAYVFELTGTAGQVFNVFGGGSAHWRVKFDTDDEDPRTADLEDIGVIGSPGSAAAVIAVANYEIPGEDGDGSSTANGPLVTYDDAWTPPPKPDLAATGERIRAARSRFATEPGFCVTLPRHDSTSVKSGTSMAAPHVAGLVALMLEKNPNLTLTEIRERFRFLSGHTLDRDVYGAGIVDAQATLDAVEAP